MQVIKQCNLRSMLKQLVTSFEDLVLMAEHQAADAGTCLKKKRM